VAALAPLHRAAGIKRIVVCTYQAVSGTGRAGVRTLEQQREAAAEGTEMEMGAYSHPIYNNCIPQVGSLRERFPGYYSEEIKMIEETRKIFGDDDIAVSATCVRVPVANSHSEAINVELGRDMSAEEARELLEGAEGVVVQDDPGNGVYPLAAEADGSDPVYVGRIRKDPSQPNTIDFWCVSDNLLKGAALNTVQIAEKAIEMGLV
jgi:aspartate-semialdehyde dehydrogenase